MSGRVMRGVRPSSVVIGALCGCALFAAAVHVRDARAQAKAPGVTITVNASGFRNTTGKAIVAVYTSKESWLKLDKAYKVVQIGIQGPSLQATFTDMPPGVYAVSVIHDQNSNGKLDMHWLPIPGPDEGAGVSNDATATFGPPSYGDARLAVGDKGGVVALKIRY